MYVNLLPSELVAQSRLVRSLKSWGLLIALWVATLVAIIAPFGLKALQIQEDLRYLHTQVGPLRLKESKTQKISFIASDLRTRSQRIQSVLPPNRIPSLLGIFGKTFQAKNSPTALQDFQVTIQEETSSNAKPATQQSLAGNKPPARFTTQIVVRGYTGTNPSVAEIIQRLEEFEVFQAVNLRSTRDSFVSSQQVDEFELECKYVE
jgi:hypothetical protein